MLRKYLGVLAILATLFISATGTVTPAIAQTNGEVPGTTLGIKSDTDLLRFVRTGNAGSTQMKGELSAVMIQSEGDNWRAFRNGPLSVYGAYGLAGIISLLVVFYWFAAGSRLMLAHQKTGLCGLERLIDLPIG